MLPKGLTAEQALSWNALPSRQQNNVEALRAHVPGNSRPASKAQYILSMTD